MIAHRVRPAVAGDASRLEAIYRECRAEAGWLPAASRAGADFARDSRGETVLVAVGSDGSPEGFVSVWEPDAFVHHLYVRRDSRRQGIGGLLLRSLAGRLPMPWRLKCLRANREALAFYAREGWMEVSAGEAEDGPYAVLERHARHPDPIAGRRDGTTRD